MLRKLRARLTYANVMATLAMFVALGGGAYAVAKIGADDIKRNAVRSKHIKNSQVKKKDLGVPARYTSAGLPVQSGACDTEVGWNNAAPFAHNNEVGFYRDPFGIVHLQGTAVKCTAVPDTIFTMPAGHRPEGTVDTLGVENGTDARQVFILATGEVAATTPSLTPGEIISLEGISFRCAPSGQNGCP